MEIEASDENRRFPIKETCEVSDQVIEADSKMIVETD
jgi:hypothetical protein